MNIFATSKCPVESAKFLDDKRVVKMCLETAQILATAINEHGGEATYKSTHRNHPAVVWARATLQNYLWTFAHYIALCEEYYSRFDKVHKCESYKNEFFNGARCIPLGELTPFVNCAANKSKGVSYKHVEDVHEAYRLYLADRWETDVREPRWFGSAA